MTSTRSQAVYANDCYLKTSSMWHFSGFCYAVQSRADRPICNYIQWSQSHSVRALGVWSEQDRLQVSQIIPVHACADLPSKWKTWKKASCDFMSILAQFWRLSDILFVIFTARRYASAGYAVVCLSFTIRCCVETTGRIDLVFSMEASFYLSQTVLWGIFGIPNN